MSNGKKSKWHVDSYNLGKSGVQFTCSDSELKAVFDDCEKLCLQNRKVFGDYEVLIEGAKYNGVWLETQPMGGEMYAKRDLRTALANILIFLRNQRRDGKFPGMISQRDMWQSVAVHYDWMQGCFLAHAALKLYYLIGEDRTYLETVYGALRDFDEYLWSCRDSNGNGCLESFCIWDTGEDNCTVHILHGLKMPDHGAWGKDTPPCDRAPFPYDSPQYMGYSYAARDVLSRISAILGNGKEKIWRERADEVRAAARRILWDEERGAFFQRDSSGEFVRALTQENIKCMYLGLMTQDMADVFVKRHLLCEEEFWTPYPFPAIAANDPYFHVNDDYSNCKDLIDKLDETPHGIDDNSWSGPLNGLIWQRSIDALMNYGYHAETALAGRRILDLLKKHRRYVQNYNPFTGEPANGADGYGPTMLAALEYVSLLCGVNIQYDKIYWSAAVWAAEFCYTQLMCGKTYTLRSDGKTVRAFIDEELIFSSTVGVRIVTDRVGKPLLAYGIGECDIELELEFNGTKFVRSLAPNEELALFDI